MAVSTMFIFYLCLSVSYDKGKVGKTCISDDGRKGLYKPLWECKSLVENLEQTGVLVEKLEQTDVFSLSCFRKSSIHCCVEPNIQEDEEEKIEEDKTTTTPKPVKRISEIKCEEYSKPVTLEVVTNSLRLDSSPKITKEPNCDYGYSTRKNQLIFGGEPSRRGEFPHMAAIGKKHENGDIEWLCGGSLISEKFVLTAAHCFSSLLKVVLDTVRLGDQNLNNTDDDANHIDFEINQTKVTKHPWYNGNRSHDIALIELMAPVIFDKYIRPACLWTNDIVDSDTAIATGWGKTNHSNSGSDELMKVTVEVIDNEQCGLYYLHYLRQKFSGVKDTHICAGDRDAVRDSCTGDSGGPLQMPAKENPCVYNVIGVINIGIGCAAENVPGLYARVSKYVGWIEDIVWKNSE